MKHLRIKTSLFRRAALSLLTLVMAFTAQTAWADYGWYDGSMIIGGATTDCTAWSTDSNNPTDIGIVTDMTITNIALSVWSDANDRAGADMYFRIWDGGSSQVGDDQHLWLGDATRIEGKAHDFAISWTGTLDLAAAVSLTLIPGKTYYIDMYAKTYRSGGGDEWYSGDNSSNYHAKLTIRPANYVSGDCTVTLNDVVLTVSGNGAMANYTEHNTPWNKYRNLIKSIVIEDGVTSIGDHAFFDFTNNPNFTITIPNSVTRIGQSAFRACVPLTSITIGSGVKSIGDNAFYGCTSLASVYVMATTPPTLDGTATNTFYGNASSGRKIYVPANSVGNSSTDGTYKHNWSAYESDIEALPVTDSGNCGANGNNCTYTLYGNGQLVISGTGAMENYNDYDYNYSPAPWNSSHRNDITSVVIENGVTTIGNHAFYKCKNLASVTIPASVTSIGKEAFWSCNGLTTIDIPARVTTIGLAAFSDCGSLASVSIPASVTSIGDGAFYNCGSNATVLTVTFAAGSTLTTIGNEAFHGAKLTSISIPASVTTISPTAFCDCNYLASVSIPASVTSIGDNAFSHCGSLASVSIPASVTSIGELAFSNCGSLTSVTVYANPSCTLGSGAFNDCSNLTAIYVFSDKEKDFEKAEGWKNYADADIDADIIQPNTNVTVSGVTARQNLDITTDYWCTYYHPQANVKINTSGVKMFKASLSGDNLTLEKVEGNNVIKAGQAVVLKAATSDALNMELTSLAPTGDFSGNELKGTSVAITGEAGNIYVLNAKPGTGAGFYKLSSNGTLGANKAYLIYDDSIPDPGTGGAREFFGFGDTTGINDVRGQKEDVRGEYYDLQGRRVSHPTKGLYIVNGKKVVIK